MSRVYESLKEVVQDTLQRSKATGPLARVKGSDALSLNDEMEELEKIVADRISKLKTAVKEGEAVVSGEVQHAMHVIEGLKENIVALEAKINEMEETVRRKDSAAQKMEESLNAKIHNLQIDVKKKEEALEGRGNEVNDLKSKIEGQAKQVAQLESAIQKARVEAADQAKRVEQLGESSRTKIAALEAQLKDTEEIARKKESTIKGLEQSLAVKVQHFESQVKNKGELLTARDAEIKDLNSQLKLLTRGIKEMSSFFKQSEALSAVEVKGAGPIVLEEPVNGRGEKPAAPQLKAPAAASKVMEAPREIVSPEFFQRITGELTQVVGPMASMIVRDHVVALGETMETFPKIKLTELVKVLSEEIGDENLKAGFRQRLAASL